MRVACVVEGLAEFDCVPVIVARMGHTPVKTLHCKGGNNTECDFDKFVVLRVVPRVLGLAENLPDKILIVVDREGRRECCPDLAAVVLARVVPALRDSGFQVAVGVVISDRSFESVLFADFELLDALTIHAGNVSVHFAGTLDGKKPCSVVEKYLRPGQKYDKRAHGRVLAGKIRLGDPVVLGRSRSLRKLTKELA